MAVSRVDRSVTWCERLRRYASSTFTVAEFCRQEGVSVANFYTWRRRLPEAATAPSRKPVLERSLPTSPAFQPLWLAGGGRMTIELAGGLRIELPAEPSLLRVAVAELAAAASIRLRGDA